MTRKCSTCSKRHFASQTPQRLQAPASMHPCQHVDASRRLRHLICAPCALPPSNIEVVCACCQSASSIAKGEVLAHIQTYLWIAGKGVICSRSYQASWLPDPHMVDHICGMTCMSNQDTSWLAVLQLPVRHEQSEHVMAGSPSGCTTLLYFWRNLHHLLWLPVCW